mmetsp:Transcript_1004/g.2958  ORF Transcript_1004/g.2958 Transcript_1004/m.2958 type:complete len:439 (+) Transcript_1004:194-1510(+)
MTPREGYAPLLTDDGAATGPTTRERFRRLGRNVKLISIFGFLFHCGWSVWERNLFPVYFAAEHGVQGVGYVQSAQGLVALVAAPLIGTWMDATSSTARVGRFTVVVGCAALAGVLAAFARGSEAWTYVALCVWGVLLSAQGIYCDTMLAASSEKGPERQFAFVAKSTLWRLGNVVGQAVNLVYFWTNGDSWESRGLVEIMSLGVVLCFSVVLLAWVREVADAPGDAPTPSPAGMAARAAEAADAPELRPPAAPWYRRPPQIILAAVVLRVIGKGATMRLIPVLFADVYGLRPASLTLVVLAAQVVSVGAPLACDSLSRLVGRAPTMVLVRLVEPAALATLALSGDAWIAAAAFGLYLGLPVGTRAIEKAVLMDHAHKTSRARWNAVESINRGTWAGSAALGGYLAHAYGYEAAFLASAAFTLAATIVLSLLLCSISTV